MGSAVSKTLSRKDKMNNMIKKVIRGMCYVALSPIYFAYLPIILVTLIGRYAFDDDMPDFMVFVLCVVLEVVWIVFLCIITLDFL